MRVLGIIPARAGSQRVPGKNWRPLGGRPLADYVMAASARATSLTEVVVSTDSEEVLALGRAYPAFHCILRPAALSTDTAPAIGYVHHALEQMQASGHGTFTAVAIIQPTSPFTLAEDIDATIALLRDSRADSAVSISEIPHDLNPLKLKIRDAQNQLHPYFEAENGRMAAGDMPRVYVRNGSVYAATRATIDQGLIIGPDCRGYLMPRHRSVDINDAFDWEIAEFLLSRHPTKTDTP